MKRAAKLIIIDKDNKYLLMYRNNHPTFGIDPDIPGGTLEEGESVQIAMMREVYEEIGVAIDESVAKNVYSGKTYSTDGTYYSLFIAKLDKRPEVTISWEHSSYEWIGRDGFLKKVKKAKDTYMHMVYDAMKNIIP